MDPCEINVLITSITNMLFCKLPKEKFIFLSIFFNELSKSMFTTSVFDNLNERKDERKEERKHNQKEEQKDEKK